jgi:ABC-2 type transport system ATP-binding protein
MNMRETYVNSTSRQVLGSSESVWTADMFLHNTSSPHALPSFLALLGQLRVWGASNGVAPVLTVTTYPIRDKTVRYTTENYVVNLVSSILMLVPFTFYPSQFVNYIVRERESGHWDVISPHLMPAAYWLATYGWNMIVWTAFVTFSVVFYAVGNAFSIIGNFGDASYLWISLLLYGACVIPMSYIMSTWFTRSTTAQNSITMIHFTCGIVLVIATSSIDLLPDNDTTSEAKAINKRWATLFRYFPTYAIGESMVKAAALPLYRYLHMGEGMREELEPSILPLLQFPIYIVGLILYQTYLAVEFRNLRERYFWTHWRAFTRNPHQSCEPWNDASLLLVDDDPGTVAERNFTQSTDEGVHGENVWKRYSQNQTLGLINAVLHVRRGDCVVVAGPNGSGKTTLLRCLGGVEPPSFGSVKIDDHELSFSTRELRLGRAQTGYVHARSGINEDLTPFTHLHVVAYLRGLQNNTTTAQHIIYLLETLGLQRFRHTQAKDLTLPLQRRLALAISLVGYPSTLIFDEPTTGLDPVGRRQFWAALQAAPSSTSIVLSTHHFDDVEMVSKRVLLLDEGRQRYLGVTSEIKRSNALQLQIVFYLTKRVTLSEDEVAHRARQKEMLVEFMHELWSASSLVMESQCALTFKLDVTPPAEPVQTIRRAITLRGIYDAIKKKRSEWMSHPCWVTQRADMDSRETPSPFEVYITQTSFSMVMESLLGSKSNAVSHMAKMMNADCRIDVRSEHV